VIVAFSAALAISVKAAMERTASGTPTVSVGPSAPAPVAKVDCPKAGDKATAKPGEPAGASEDGGITLGCDGAPGGPLADETKVTVQVISDYICPVCKRFEDELGADLEQAMRDGQVKVTLYPLGYLDAYSTSGYSSRAARAAVAVAGLAPEKFRDFDALLWENQPPEGGAGLSDEEIAGLARQAGVSDAVIAEFTSGAYDDWVSSTTAAVIGSDGFQGTPWVLIGDGTRVYIWNWSQGDLQKAIAAVAAGEEP
jgi:protein-disulfide isomerase